MSAPEPLEVAGRWYEAVNDGELERALSHLAPDVVWVSPPDAPRPDTYEGHDRVREMWKAFTRAFSSFRIEPAETSVVGDRVVVRVTIAGTVESNGSPFEMSGAQVLDVRGERIAGVREFLTVDEARRAAQRPLGRPE